MQLSPLISAEELLSLPRQEYILIDAGSGAVYQESHLQGALFVDLNTDLADIKPNAAHGGRHPLPTPQDFGKTLGKLGIKPDSHVVVYDDKNASNAAARFWWMLRAAGHIRVQVLDGGLQAAVRAGFPTTSEPATATAVAPYPVEGWSLPLADLSLIDRATQEEDFLIIDVRDSERYLGKTEPIDLIAGHIPRAVNIPFSENLDDEGKFLPPSQLKAKYSKALGDADPHKVIVHCGSGVTACHTLLAIAAAELETPRLYVGSWSEWSRNDRPMISE